MITSKIVIFMMIMLTDHVFYDDTESSNNQ